MNIFLVVVLIVLMILVLVSLVRGVVAFLKTSKEELDRDPSAGPSENQKLQNKMMFARIKYQALAILVLFIMGAFASKGH